MKNQFDWGESAKKGDEFFGLQGWQKGFENAGLACTIAHAHLSMPLKFILCALLWKTLNIATVHLVSGLKVFK